MKMYTSMSNYLISFTKYKHKKLGQRNYCMRISIINSGADPIDTTKRNTAWKLLLELYYFRPSVITRTFRLTKSIYEKVNIL